MLLAYTMLGLGLGFSTFVPTALVISNWFGERRGIALGIVMGGQSLGGMVMAPLVGYAIARGMARRRTGARGADVRDRHADGARAGAQPSS